MSKSLNRDLRADYGNNTLLTPSRSATHWEAELNEVQCIICKHNLFFPQDAETVSTFLNKKEERKSLCLSRKKRQEDSLLGLFSIEIRATKLACRLRRLGGGRPDGIRAGLAAHFEPLAQGPGR